MDKSVLNHFSNIPISSILQDRIIEVDAYIKDEKRDVYILDSEAAVYMIPLDKYNKDFDMFLKGNLGAASEEGQIEKIKNISAISFESGGSFYAANIYCSCFSNGVNTPRFLCNRFVL